MFNLENLNDEYFAKLDVHEVLDIKELSTEDKIKCFKFFLTSDIIKNNSVITNLFLILNGLSGFSADMQTDKRLFFNSLSEYVDIKLALKTDIDNFKIKLLEYYLGIVEGLHIYAVDLKIHITNTHFGIFNLISLKFISKLVLEYLDRIDIKKVKPVFCANELYSKIHNPNSLLIGFLQDIIREV